MWYFKLKKWGSDFGKVDWRALSDKLKSVDLKSLLKNIFFLIFSFPVSKECELCGRQINGPQNIQPLIPSTCDYVTWYSKRDSCSCDEN